MTTRIQSLPEARSDYVPPQRRRTPWPRAVVLETDPAWLHPRFTVRMRCRGEQQDLFGIGSMAAALRRTPKTIRQLIAQGVLPDAQFRLPARTQHGQRRLWLRNEVLAAAEAAEELGLLGTRPATWQDVPLRERIRAKLATA